MEQQCAGLSNGRQDHGFLSLEEEISAEDKKYRHHVCVGVAREFPPGGGESEYQRRWDGEAFGHVPEPETFIEQWYTKSTQDAICRLQQEKRFAVESKKLAQPVDPVPGQGVDKMAGVKEVGRRQPLLDVDCERNTVPIEVPGR